MQTLTIENTSAAAIKERRLNCMAIEGINRYLGSGFFDPVIRQNQDEAGNASAMQTFIKLARDPFVGNRQDDEIDLDGILALEQQIFAYFGNTDALGFNYTFDSTDLTFQQTAQLVFDAANCIAYREGTVISALFEKPQDVPVMLFTHRSKVPDSETYTRNFNQSTISDGVEFKWVDQLQNTTETILLPPNAVNTTSFEIAGIRNSLQATIRAKRELNKILYRKENCQLTVTAEGRFLRPNDLVRIVKGCRVATFDGEVIAQAGLLLTLSQDVYFENLEDYSITLKDENGGVENIACIAGAQPNQVLLQNVPFQTIRTGIESRRTEFSFAADSKQFAQLWLVQGIDNKDKYKVGLQAINYTDKYYQDDFAQGNDFNNDFNNDLG